MGFERYGGFGTGASRPMVPRIAHSKTGSAKDLRERMVSTGKSLEEVAVEAGLTIEQGHLIMKLDERTNQHA